MGVFTASPGSVLRFIC